MTIKEILVVKNHDKTMWFVATTVSLELGLVAIPVPLTWRLI